MNDRNTDRLVVREVFVGDMSPGDAFVVALAEQPGGRGRTLIFQKSTNPRLPAFRRPYSLSDDMGNTVYGGVVDYELRDADLWLQFNDEVTRTLGWPAQLDVELRVPAQSVEDVKAALSRLLRPADS